MPLKNQTIFSSSGDNEACAAELADALGKEGVKSRTTDNGDGSWSVFYEHDDAVGLQPLIIAIEEGHPKAPSVPATEETSGKSTEETASAS